MSSDEFGSAVRARLKEMGRSQEWLGAEVARLTDRDAPYRQASVWAWIEGENPAPAEVVFAMEVALQLRSGTLSRLLGYLPVTSRSARTVPDAIAADPKLTAMGRRVVLAVYEELVDGGPDGS